MFYAELLEEVRQMPGHLEEGLVELFARGISTCDHYGGIRALLTSQKERRHQARFRRSYSSGVQISGRWSLINRAVSRRATIPTEQEAAEYAAKVLLRRYGVVFRALLANEGKFFPAWGDLRSIYRRMEDRGEIRGGRFVSTLAGEQFALPEAVDLLRDTRNQQSDGKAVTVHAADPLNLSGILNADSRVTARAATYLVYRKGKLVTIAGRGDTKSPVTTP